MSEKGFDPESLKSIIPVFANNACRHDQLKLDKKEMKENSVDVMKIHVICRKCNKLLLTDTEMLF